ADPTIPEAQIGQTFTTKESDFTEVPDNLRHKVTVRLKAELSSVLGGQYTTTQLEHTFITAEVAGKPLSVGHFVNAAAPSGSITYTYSPYILIGQNDGDISDDPIIRGTDYQEFYSGILPISNLTLTGAFLEMDVVNPNGTAETYERALFD